MSLSAIVPPRTDPTPIFELFRGSYATELLAASIAHFKVFDRLAAQPLDFDTLRRQLGLAERPAIVLFCTLRAMGFIAADTSGRLALTPLTREHLTADGYFDVSDYVGMAAGSPGVREMIERLTSNTPAGQKPDEQGAAFIYREGLDSAMEKQATARHFTLALAGRAKNVAPHLAASVDLSSTRLLVDVGGGTGIYSIACLQRNPRLKAIVWDRPEVLKVAAEMAAAYGVPDRLELVPGDMFVDPMPPGGDVVLLSNILHDWDRAPLPELVGRCAAGLARGGRC